MARQEIQRFYQKIKVKEPAFDVTQNDAGFSCALKLPAVDLATGSFPDQHFLGHGRNKKAAILAAADQGLVYLQTQPAFQVVKPVSRLWDVLQNLFSDEGLRKDPELEGNLILAQKYNDGWLPIQHLLQARAVLTWIKQQQNAPLQDADALTELLQEQLPKEGTIEAGNVQLTIDNGVAQIKRMPTYEGRKGGMNVMAALDATLALGNGRRCTCIIIPCNSSQAIQEVEISGGGSYWAAMADALHVTQSQLLYWNKVGKQVEVFMDGQCIPSDLDDDRLKAALEKVLGPQPRSRQASAAEAPSQPTIATKECASDDPGMQPVPLFEIRQPVMYSKRGSGDVNARASRLTGRPVHGDVLLSFCRLRPCEWNTPSVKWASFTLPLFWAWAGATLPGAVYAAARRMPMIARLPHTFRNSKGWFGPPPSELLARIAQPAICLKTPSSTEVPNHDDPSLTDSNLEVHLLGDEAAEAAEASAASAEVAQQQAALNMVHVLEKRLLSALREGSVSTPKPDSKRRKVEPDTDLLSVRVEERGEGGKEVPGVLINFEYRISVKGGEFSGRLVEAGSGRLEYASGCFVPAVETLIDTAGVGGKASCTVSLPLGGPNELSPQYVICSLEVQSDQKVHYVGTPQSSVSLFDPPMATQRCTFMAALLEQHTARTVLDIGCGDGKLIEYLMLQARDGRLPIKKVVGVDLDGVAVKRGQKRMLSRNPDLLQSPTSAELQLFQGDIACQATTSPSAWGELAGTDVAVFQEVVEHLDPEPLRWLGPALLAGLRPRVLLLSTPNFEYNAVLHHLNSQLLPNKHRNSDHRFEWTRMEFQQWCGRLAQEYGYDVSYDGLGKATSEAEALKDPNAEVYGKDVGHATQVAIFQRQAKSVPLAGKHSFTPIFLSNVDVTKQNGNTDATALPETA